MMEAGITHSDIKGEYFEEENTEFKDEIEIEDHKNQLDNISEEEPEKGLMGESIKSPNPPQDATISMDIDNNNKPECPFCKMKTEDLNFHLRIFDSCGDMQRMKIYQDGLEAKILSQAKTLEAVKLELEVNKKKLAAEREKHEQEIKTAREKVQGLLDKAERDLEETKMKLANKKLELTAERGKHEEEMKTAKENAEHDLEQTNMKLANQKLELTAEREKHEEMKSANEEVLSHKMRQLLLERDLEFEKKKHKKNLKKFLCVLKKSQSTLKHKKKVVFPPDALLDLSTEVLHLGIELSYQKDDETTQKKVKLLLL